MRIYPQQWEELLSKESKDYAYINAKNNYSLGFHKFKDSDISFNDFIKKLDNSLSENFEIILWANTPNTAHFSEILIINKTNGQCHLIEFFEFDKNDVYFEFEQSQLDQTSNKSIRHLIKHRYNTNHNPYLKIEDNPVDRLRNIQNQIINNTIKSFKSSTENINTEGNKKYFNRLQDEISKKKIFKHFVFGSLDCSEGEEYFITTENEYKSYSDSMPNSKFKEYNHRYKDISFIGLKKIDKFIDSLKGDSFKIKKEDVSWNAQYDKKIKNISDSIIIKTVQDIFKKSFKDHETENRLILSEDQERILKSPQKLSYGSLKFNLIEGVPGSGKTLMLARKAEEYMQKNKRVLVTHFTKVLKSYEAFNIDAQTSGYANRDNLNYPICHISHFHKIASDYRKLMEIPDYIKSNRIDTEGFLLRDASNFNWPSFTRELSSGEKFDLIVIDEAQNFEDYWIVFLSTLLRENGELYLFYDREQTIYQKVKNTNFQQFLREKSAKNKILTQSFRLTKSNISVLNKIKKFEKNPSTLYEKGQIELFDYSRIEGEEVEVWFNISDYRKSGGFIDVDHKTKRISNTISRIINEDKIKLEDCLILTDEHLHSSLIEKHLEDLDIEAKSISPDISSFHLDNSSLKKMHFSTSINSSQEEESSEKKLAYEFYSIQDVEKDKVTISTIHSSQGQEMSHVFVYLSKNNRIGNEMLRVALTRASKNIYVFNDHPKWNKFKDHFENSLNKEKILKIESFLSNNESFKYVDSEKFVTANESVLYDDLPF